MLIQKPLYNENMVSYDKTPKREEIVTLADRANVSREVTFSKNGRYIGILDRVTATEKNVIELQWLS